MKNFLSLLAYRGLLLVFSPFVLCALLIRSISHAEYRQRLTERLGILPKQLKSGGIIIHAASVGEVIAIKPFVEQIISADPNQLITITTFTPTGSAQVNKLYNNNVQHCYFPLDIFCCSWLFLKKLQPSAIIVMETELWPNIIHQAANLNTKLLLINGRLSKKSCRHYQKITPLIAPCINRFDYILCQSKDNQENFLALGAQQEKCLVSGNLKYDIQISEATKTKQLELAQFINPSRPAWLVASTHPGDEELIIKSFKQILAHHPNLLLILVPRHPERFEQVATLCTEANLTLVRRSTKNAVENNTQVWLLDTLGELMSAYGLASFVTMGGSFSNIGGHNPLEPALYQKPIVVGPDMTNFKEVNQQLLSAKGIIQLPKSDNHVIAITKAITELLQNEDNQQLGENAYQVVKQNQGASQRTFDYLQKLI